MDKNMTPEQTFFRAMPQLSVLENEQIFELTKRTTKRKYRKGEYVFFQGDQVEHLYFLEMGKVEIFKSDINGRKLTLWYIEESEIFCLATVFSLDAFASAEVIEDSLIYSLSRDDFEEIIATSGELSRNLIRCICGKMATYSSLLDDLAFKKIESRLAKILLRNLQSSHEYDFVCLLTQEELASLVGTSREVVGRCLKSFRDRGILATNKKGSPRLIIVQEHSELNKIVDVE
ncbi:cAMP-binding protein [Desulfomarina profundi]|uniref:cAMP-binding protein n=1 Tax=Desulfomarina profundi TaxID=2772557 RepID=A0A8D5FGV7_9BACT|nr:Crp/Fnr family transcriptional regulator [Desulfomarina profundi]BCL61392.1 cAMP-binding protein [Desulfomarina profundi]